VTSRYDNDRIYADFAYTDETHAGDAGGNWNGADTYTRRYRCRVPRKLLEKATTKGDFTPVYDWLESKQDVREVWRK